MAPAFFSILNSTFSIPSCLLAVLADVRRRANQSRSRERPWESNVIRNSGLSTTKSIANHNILSSALEVRGFAKKNPVHHEASLSSTFQNTPQLAAGMNGLIKSSCGVQYPDRKALDLLRLWFVKQTDQDHDNSYADPDNILQSFSHKLLFAAHRHNKNYGTDDPDNYIKPKQIHDFFIYLASLTLRIMLPKPIMVPTSHMGMEIWPTADGTKNPTTTVPNRIFDKSEKYSASKSVWSLLNRMFSIYQVGECYVN